MRTAFKNRSGRVIAISRLALATAFLLAIWLDPARAGRALVGQTLLTLGAYAVFGLVVLMLTWRNWWLDFRLAVPVHVIDVSVFGVVAFLTEDHASTPFFAIFVFLVMSGLRRFGWRGAVVTALAALVVYSLGGFAAQMLGIGSVRWDRFFLRRYYLVLLTLLLIWFALNHTPLRGQTLPGVVSAPASDAPATGLAELLAPVRDVLGAARLVFAWTDPDEPFLFITRLDAIGTLQDRLAPDMVEAPVAEALAGCAFLFDATRRRAVAAGARLTALAGIDPVPAALLARLGMSEGLAVPVQSDGVSGLLFASGIDGMSVDDLAVARAVGAELEAALNRASLLAVTAAAAAGRTRLALARDIHDSVLQLLAGAGFRLAGVARSLGRDAPELAELQDELVRGQTEIRDYLASLRDTPGEADASAALAELAQRLERQWGVGVGTADVEAGVRLPARIVGEVRQLTRELVANAVRHGKARQVRLWLRRAGGEIEMGAQDDGIGFAAAGARAGDQPWSLSERARTLGGRLSVASGDAGSRIAIWIKAGESI